MALQAGHLFGNYRIVRLLGEGGFGEVYLAENPLIERRAAVKVLHTALAQDAELVRRFLNEARAASAIRHRNIIEVFDAGITPEGAPYILMEFLEGVSLQKRLADKGRLALPQALEIARQAGSALAAAHAAGIVHRDLKPENLFLVPEAGAPGGERVKILDFGIAKVKRAGGTGGTMRTQAGLIMGSPAYMSPEQCRDSADVDLRSDIYSFAIIVYEMLAGRTPYVAASGTEMLLMHLTGTPPPLRGLVADLPAHVEAAIKRALARARADRFDSMASFVGALRGGVGGEMAELGRLSPSEELPAVGEKRTRVAASITTFSRTTGEVAAASDDVLLAASRNRRWPFLAVGGAAAAGLALFLLVRPSHEPAPPPVPGTLRIGAPDAGRATPVATAGPDAAPVAVLPSRADSGTTPPVAAGAEPSNKPAHAPAVAAPVGRRRAKLQAPRSTPPLPAAVPSSSPSLPPALPTQDNPAGF
jgi:eukaryotic-like serine/threonine-protein kinase